MKIKTGDNVKILSGREDMRGKTGKVLQIITNKKTNQSYVVVDGMNLRKKHMKSRQRGYQGQVIELPAPIHMSNVMLIDPKGKKPTRVGYKKEGSKKVRIAKTTGELID
ncbi:MAG: 50S ribosomal protein L24 [Candidatus Magasanikbacteria bacterium]|jgi:large subunit ribosomal protein L24|nr:50S ribosomal protein L24 [Candidatus Magasanikbacteria bacterium]